ncbi:tRNA lysidine(34) synthetase TilS [Neiella sp. HB171785]|uniref:tRNA(Ile)-lysidine synthase n=1 Tax=Neiella litorisoli TaxID=2771431 RepID=A0A8J6QIL3_9GAMM|nr:tRNA lysidine(34) synthetase TilS [Neiella litorisoli]MBD1389337.1 tRNA lysidine(34) synthetase TilS [Neiella litorisoli]
MLTTLFCQLDELQQRGVAHFIVAYSGGIDSQVLLHGCSLYQQQHPAIELSACHIHHGLSANADSWLQHCQASCQQLAIPFIHERVQLVRGSRQSLEAVARDARYRVLETLVDHPSCAVLTGHHQDDQVETLFLSLKRGSGLDGLSAMPSLMPFARGWLARPMLQLSRAELQQYANEQQLSWIEDESNQDDRFDRNFIRNQLLPLCQQRWPSFNQTASRSVSLLAQDRAVLEEITAQDYQSCVTANGLSISALKSLSNARRERVMRHWLRQRCVPLWSYRQQQQAWQSVALAQQDAQPQLSWAGWQLRRYRDDLVLLDGNIASYPQQLTWQWPQPLSLPNGTLSAQPSDTAARRLKGPLDGQPVSIRFGQLKQRVRPAMRQGSRELKKVWQEMAVPPWLRQQIPLLFYGEECVAAIGYWVAQGYECQPGESGWHIELS